MALQLILSYEIQVPKFFNVPAPVRERNRMSFDRFKCGVKACNSGEAISGALQKGVNRLADERRSGHARFCGQLTELCFLTLIKVNLCALHDVRLYIAKVSDA